ncbi:hypothetical protein Tco_1014596 [Tanacetum coccineum]
MADLAFIKQHNMVAYLEKTEENDDFHQILDFLTSSSINFSLTVSPTIYASYIEQFWITACLKTINSEKQIHANVNGKTVFYLKLLLLLQPPKDPNTYRRTKRDQNTKVPQSGGSPNKVGDEAINEEMFDSVERAVTIASSLEAEQASGGHTLRSGEDNKEHQIELTDNVPNTPYDSPLPGVNTPGSDEGGLELIEFMDLVTKLSYRVFDLEKVKTAQAKEIIGLKRRSLGKKDVSKQGRKHLKTRLQFREDAFNDIDDLVDEGMAFVQKKDADNQGKIAVDDTEVVKGSGDTKVLDTKKAVNTAGEGVSTASVPETVSTAAPRTPPTTTTVFDDEDVTMAMAQTLIKMKEEKAKEKGVVIKDVEDSSRPVRSITTLQPLPTIDPKYKGKGILQETESVEKIKKKCEKEKEELRLSLNIISNDDSEVDYEPLSRKFPIMNWEYQLLEKMEAKDMYVYKLTRADGCLSYHGDTQSFLRRLNRQDLNDLYRQQKRIQDFTPIDSEKEAQKPGKRLKRVAGSNATQKSPKKPKVMKSAKDVTEEEAAEYEKEKEELRLSLMIISKATSDVTDGKTDMM